MTRTLTSHFPAIPVAAITCALASALLLSSLLLSGCDKPEGKTLSGQYLMTLDGERDEILVTEKRPFIINFWATWCRPCYEEIPLLVDANTRVKDGGPIILGVVLDAPTPELLQKLQLNYPVFNGYDEYGRALARQSGLDPDSPYLPYTIFVDSDRTIVHAHRGILDRQILERAIRELH